MTWTPLQPSPRALVADAALHTPPWFQPRPSGCGSYCPGFCDWYSLLSWSFAQELTKFFWKGPKCKYPRFSRPYNLCPSWTPSLQLKSWHGEYPWDKCVCVPTELCFWDTEMWISCNFHVSCKYYSSFYSLLPHPPTPQRQLFKNIKLPLGLWHI